MTQRAKPTLAMIADKAGVSRATASRAFSRPELLNPATVTEILTIAQDLGYVPNTMARALSTGRTGNIGLVVSDIANPFFPPLVKAVQDQTNAQDLCLFLGSSGESAHREDILLQRLRGQTDGIILAASRLSDDQIRAHADLHPLVVINRDIKGLSRVIIDTRQAMQDAVDWLVARGHRHLAYLAGPKGSWSNQQRGQAVQSACARHNLTLLQLDLAAPDGENGANAAREAVAAGATGLLAFDDVIALGAQRALLTADHRLPDNLDVIGCDDALPDLTSPPLSTLSGHSGDAGWHAVQLLLRLVAARATGKAGLQDMQVSLNARFIARR